MLREDACYEQQPFINHVYDAMRMNWRSNCGTAMQKAFWEISSSSNGSQMEFSVDKMFAFQIMLVSASIAPQTSLSPTMPRSGTCKMQYCLWKSRRQSAASVASLVFVSVHILCDFAPERRLRREVSPKQSEISAGPQLPTCAIIMASDDER